MNTTNQAVDRTDPKFNSRTRQRTSLNVADKIPPALIQIGNELYSGTTLISFPSILQSAENQRRNGGAI